MDLQLAHPHGTTITLQTHHQKHALLLVTATLTLPTCRIAETLDFPEYKGSLHGHADRDGHSFSKIPKHPLFYGSGIESGSVTDPSEWFTDAWGE